MALFFRNVAADNGSELTFHNSHQCLARVEIANNFLTERFFLDAGGEFAHHGKGNVSLKQCKAHFAQHVACVLFGQAGLSAHGLDNTRKTGTQILKHEKNGWKKRKNENNFE